MSRSATALEADGQGGAGQGDRLPAIRVRFARVRDWWRRQVETEREARSAYAVFPLGMMAGILAAFLLGIHPPLAACALLVVSAIVAARLLGERPLALPFLFLAAVAAGLGVADWERQRTQTVILSGDATVRISGHVLLREEDERGRHRYTVAMDSTDRPVLSRPPGRVRILVSSAHEPLGIGQRYEGLVRLRPPAGPAYPRAYDFAFAPYFDGLGAYGFSLGAPMAGTERRPATWADRIAELRLAIDERIRETLPGATGAVASALVTGLRGAIPEEINEDFRITGLAHVLSISGYHMTLVAGFVMLAVRGGLALWPALASRVSTKKVAAVLALAASGFYYLLSGDNAATERSFVMIAVMLGAVLIDRPAITLRNVGFAALVVMTASPHAVLTATFQMSFAATAALVGLYGAYARRWGRRDGDLSWLRTAGLVLVALTVSSLIAAAATAPFSVYHFGRAAPFGLVANLLATPIFTFWIMPLGLAATLAMPFGLDAVPLHLMGLGLGWVFAIAAATADAFPDVATGRMSGVALLLFAAAIVAASFLASALRWIAVPLALLAITLAPVEDRPELLIFEDGKQVAILREDGSLAHLRERPSAFVADQWERAFGAGTDVAAEPAFRCDAGICRTVTTSGHRVAWTEDYEKLGEVCDTSDIAVVARAVRATHCLSGAALVTLRTLRRTGSLALETDEAGAPRLQRSVAPKPDAWNRHRHEPWPESWRRPEETPGTPVNGSGESARSAVPAP